MVPPPVRPGPVADQTPPGPTFPVRTPRPGLRPAPPGRLTGRDQLGQGHARGGRGRGSHAHPRKRRAEPGPKLASCTVAERDGGTGRRWPPRGHLESALLRRLARVTAAFTGLRRLARLLAVTRSRCSLWWAVCTVAAVPDPSSQESPICDSCCLLVIPPELPASGFFCCFVLLLFFKARDAQSSHGSSCLCIEEYSY